MYQTDYKRIDSNTIIQLQDGRVDISDDGTTTLMRAGSAGSKVGKSTYSTAIETTKSDGLVIAEFDFMIPDGSPTSHIYLADIESNAASSGYNPGVRIQVRDGLIRVERGKIGVKELWPADQDELLQTGRWYSLKVVLRPGDENTGEVKLFLDDKLVVDEQGKTIDTLYSSNAWIDRVQVGLTANVNDYDAALAVRNIKITNDQPGTNNDATYHLDAMDALPHAIEIYKTGTESRPSYVNEINPNPDPLDPRPTDPTPVDPDPVDPNPTDDGDYALQSGTGDADVLVGTSGRDAIQGYQGADEISGNSGSDVLRGGGGHDTIDGGRGSDKLFGGNRGDELHGGTGDDTIKGGNGNDLLDGGAGNDVLKGGKGKDTFVFSGGDDVITDFTAGDDKVYLDLTPTELSSVRFSQQSGNDGGVLLTQGENSLLLQGVTFSELSNSDFILA